MKRKLLSSLGLVLITALITTLAAAQTTTFRGMVTDAETGEGLAGANIVLTQAATGETAGGVASDATGRFELRGLSPGSYVITVTYIGYIQAIPSVIELSAGETESLDIFLTPTGIELNPVIVTASRRPERFSMRQLRSKSLLPRKFGEERR